MCVKHLVNIREKMPRASRAGRNKRKRNDTEGDGSPPSKVKKAVVDVDGGWRLPKCIERVSFS